MKVLYTEFIEIRTHLLSRVSNAFDGLSKEEMIESSGDCAALWRAVLQELVRLGEIIKDTDRYRSVLNAHTRAAHETGSSIDAINRHHLQSGLKHQTKSETESSPVTPHSKGRLKRKQPETLPRDPDLFGAALYRRRLRSGSNQQHESVERDQIESLPPTPIVSPSPTKPTRSVKRQMKPSKFMDTECGASDDSDDDGEDCIASAADEAFIDDGPAFSRSRSPSITPMDISIIDDESSDDDIIVPRNFDIEVDGLTVDTAPNRDAFNDRDVLCTNGITCSLSGRYKFLRTDTSREHNIVVGAQAVVVDYLGYRATYAITTWLRTLGFDIIHDDTRGQHGAECGYLAANAYVYLSDSLPCSTPAELQALYTWASDEDRIRRAALALSADKRLSNDRQQQFAQMASMASITGNYVPLSGSSHTCP